MLASSYNGWDQNFKDLLETSNQQKKGILRMSNLEKYKKCFTESFSIEESSLEGNLEYNSIEEWDSIGHMAMIASLEEAFDITMDIDDVIEFSSFDKGKELLKKYEVNIA